MTPTEKQKCIAEQMLYGLLFLHEETETLAEYAFGRKLLYWRDIIDSKEKLILRPISDLTKEITHKGYNNNQPFIPLVELAKIIKPNFKDYEFNKSEVICLLEGNSRHYELYLFNYKEIILEELDLLNKLHFDTRNLIESDEAISTEVINPYKL